MGPWNPFLAHFADVDLQTRLSMVCIGPTTLGANCSRGSLKCFGNKFEMMTFDPCGDKYKHGYVVSKELDHKVLHAFVIYPLEAYLNGRRNGAIRVQSVECRMPTNVCQLCEESLRHFGRVGWPPAAKGRALARLL